MEINDKNYKYKAKRALEAEDRLVMVLVVEALDYTNANKEDTIIDIDVEKFYDHCHRKFFKPLIERNVKFLGLDRYRVEYDLRLKFLNAMNRISIYNVEKLRLLEMGKKFIQEYIDYLNK